MAGGIRPYAKTAKIAYKILKTPKDRQQATQPTPPKHLQYEWFRDSSTAQ